MLYSISSVSNRDELLLHHYRILRGERAGLPAPFITSGGQQVNFLTVGNSSGRIDDDGSPLYKYTIMVDTPENMVPMFEFIGNNNNLDTLADLRYAEVTEGKIDLLSTNHILSPVKTMLYWYPTPSYYNQIFNINDNPIVKQIEDLVSSVNDVRNTIDELKTIIEVYQPLPEIVESIQGTIGDLTNRLNDTKEWVDKKRESEKEALNRLKGGV